MCIIYENIASGATIPPAFVGMTTQNKTFQNKQDKMKIIKTTSRVNKKFNILKAQTQMILISPKYD